MSAMSILTDLFLFQIPKELCQIYMDIDIDDEKIERITELKKLSNCFFQKLFKNFINSSCLYIDLVTVST